MAKPRILFVTKNQPYPIKAGSSQRTAILIEALQQVGDVDLFVIAPLARKKILEKAGYSVAAAIEATAQRESLIGRVLQRYFPRRAENVWRLISGAKADYSPDPGLKKCLDDILKREHFDLIVGRYLLPSAQAGIFEQKRLPVIVDIDDVDSKALKAKIDSPATSVLMRWVLQWRLPVVTDIESALWNRATKLWFSNPNDRVLSPSLTSDVIPNIPFEIPDVKTLAHSSENSKVILWVGSFNHRVNLEGVDLFLKEAWGKILEKNPDAIFRIVGSHLPDTVKKKWQEFPQVDVVGFAESLTTHYADAALSIVPLMDGAGTKIKVLESLAFKRVCVATIHSIAGYESLLQDGKSVRVGSTLQELIQPVTELLANPEVRWAMESQGRCIIEKNFIREAVYQLVANSVGKVLREPFPEG
jgi:glycosyltransferase involved in cell wall biosynthesis